MSLTNCNFRFTCTFLSLVAAIILGIVTAFAQITGVITVTTVFLWVALGIAVVTLWTLVLGAALARISASTSGCCTSVSGLLAGIQGSILLSSILLAVGIVATSLVSAILVGLLVFFLTLALTNTACYVRCLSSCGNI